MLPQDGWTPLRCAARYGHLDIVMLILETLKATGGPKGRDIKDPVILGAAYGGHTGVVEALLRAGLDIEAADNVGSRQRR